MVPAFGRALLELRRNGKRPAQPVYVVADWSLARELRQRERFALVVELEHNARGVAQPKRFDFSMLTDLEVVLIPDWVDWWAIVSPQVESVRPRKVWRALSFHSAQETAWDKVQRTMERAEPQWARQKEREWQEWSERERNWWAAKLLARQLQERT
jgi:hypothetical protein